MKIVKTSNSDLTLIEPILHEDNRGCFLENFKANFIHDISPGLNFIQDNLSVSKAGVFRGLHWQAEPASQTKLISVLKGSIIDFIMNIDDSEKDIERSLYYVELTDSAKRQLLIPPGYAHGFISLEDNTIVQYKIDKPYSPNHERSINVLDFLNNTKFFEKIGLSKNEIIQSEKDKKAESIQILNFKPLI